MVYRLDGRLRAGLPSLIRGLGGNLSPGLAGLVYRLDGRLRAGLPSLICGLGSGLRRRLSHTLLSTLHQSPGTALHQTIYRLLRVAQGLQRRADGTQRSDGTLGIAEGGLPGLHGVGPTGPGSWLGEHLGTLLVNQHDRHLVGVRVPHQPRLVAQPGYGA